MSLGGFAPIQVKGGATMSDEPRSTRRSLLALLLRHKSGLSVDELTAHLSISRNAVRQHLSSLESEGLVAVGNVRRGVGRPTQLYALTPLGAEQFPRQYSLLSGLLLSALREMQGSAGVSALLAAIAGRMAAQHGHRVTGETVAERATSVAGFLNELGYAAQSDAAGASAEITAVNCVYHHLAAEFPEVCQLDMDLIGRLTGAQVEQTECMLRGGECCRFRLTAPDDGEGPVRQREPEGTA
jgi:predicted ArsR family transcriptional regulator